MVEPERPEERPGAPTLRDRAESVVWRAVVIAVVTTVVQVLEWDVFGGWWRTAGVLAVITLSGAFATALWDMPKRYGTGPSR